MTTSNKLDALAERVASLDEVLATSARDKEMARHFMLSPGFERGKAFDFGKQILAYEKRESLKAELETARHYVENYDRNRRLLAEAEANLSSLKGKRGFVGFRGGQVKSAFLRELYESAASDLRRRVSAAEKWMD